MSVQELVCEVGPPAWALQSFLGEALPLWSPRSPHRQDESATPLGAALMAQQTFLGGADGFPPSLPRASSHGPHPHSGEQP